MLADFRLKSCLLVVLVIGCACLADSEPPVVVSTSPKTFADDVEPSLGEITVTFDQTMMDRSWSWTGGGETFPKMGGQPTYDQGRTTCSLPVKLEPGKVYWVGINSPDYQNFRSASGVSARQYVILFATKGSDGKPTPIPGDMLKEAQAINKAETKPQITSTDKLSFVLPDALGREIRSEDYAGVPVLIMCGACWCGGCQQDAEVLWKIADEYMPKGLAVIRSVSGDNELAALEFAKHYRLGFPQLMDTNREFERRYNPDGWTFLMLADAEGKVAYKCNSPTEKDWMEIKRLAGQMVKEADAALTTLIEGVRYMNKTLERSGEMQGAKRRDEFASVACRQDGKVYAVFTSNHNGNSDVFARIYDGNNWSEDRPIAATNADEYDGAVTVDNNNRAWVAWASNAEGGKYGIFVAALADSGEPCEPKRVNIGEDDAMHGRMACDDKGNIWVTYYKWQQMNGRSRDKEVYMRRFDGRRWSRQVQVSPTDVPNYEDHTEPTIACYEDGAVVCWSWDFHQPKGYTKDAANPTIFISNVSGDLEPSRPVVISAKDTDVTPSIGIIKGKTWCAWDSMVWEGRLKTFRKKVCVNQATIGRMRNTGDIKAVSGPMVNVCTPTIAVGKEGRACLVWSQTEDGNKWVLKKADFDATGNKRLEAEVLESKGNPRFCSADYDEAGKLWIAYSIQTQDGRKIAVKRL
jgi:peroxiredoxin